MVNQTRRHDMLGHAVAGSDHPQGWTRRRPETSHFDQRFVRSVARTGLEREKGKKVRKIGFLTLGEPIWDRRALLRRGAWAGVGAAGLVVAGRTGAAAEATPTVVARPPAGCDPLALLPPVPAFR